MVIADIIQPALNTRVRPSKNTGLTAYGLRLFGFPGVTPGALAALITCRLTSQSTAMWSAVVSFYTTFFYEPLFNLLVLIYNILPGHDLAVAIVVLTLITRVVLYPISHWSIRKQKMLQDLQPKLEALKAQYKDSREKQAEAQMKLFKDEKVNPLSSCLPTLLQLPFFIALFQVFQNGLKPESLSVLYPFVSNPGGLNPIGLWGLLDLSHRNIPLILLMGAAQFWQGHMLLQRRPPIHTGGAKDEDMTVLMNQQMTYLMPLVIMGFSWTFPAGVALYWFMTTLFMALQQWYIFHKDGHKNKTQKDAINTPTDFGATS
ncbi:hypothetical protein A3H10_00915 [Candidatus Uhrbacteria bacterium RIFCSPLOWO2_12_FULL_46_10]|uniref:Membrane insertase YidC/Oxa/ALB C-terminal domain-containing protein n=1 Tax=Candidatus Uhrbacteria bacterium RIFCSPLOWO2_01_FULL_47_25 TaxID=1802402 RepID=A0A1F7US29_9BACT|nr:MAG: Membrane protein insertase, YidC/Oxa1 family [Parcubacteria group bacterium GW2011_GWA2_46_9]OGL59267.1 MAG: hypothetical protein A2752_01180 [Candidatus Uhrbacteria bacterium RIFCSPHIGHO2_01_FULL_46_23]OGL68488.1 MAG: hypothetical protein A3D60_02635 [Candidatus Uhrbacteria bacterium RIFCSPHIGHO2_02_FULL_47_29]OGL75585.1 MAG: hypothetical protein A3E96_00900 [Candidatus Uhrbacteria bacterium RIFCSPHIGHO2_12_FULL_46_13]OGL81100.1 MAG: hypothetical protein A2936_00665 [Candidatus Uhrbact